MKKFLITLAILTAAISSALISQGISHEIRRCRYGHCLKVRKTTNRVFSYDQYNRLRRVEKANRIAKNEGDRNQFWNNYKKQISTPFVKQNYAAYRASHSSLFPRNNNTLVQPHKIAVRETAYHQNYKWDSLKNDYQEEMKPHFFAESTDSYTIQFPSSFTKTSNGNFYDGQRDLTVIASEGSFSCNGVSFQICASKEGADSREISNLNEIKNLSQKFGLRQIVVNGKTVLNPTYRETFISGDYGQEQVHFFYTTMNTYTGNIVKLEGFAPAINKFAASNLMEELFRSTQL